MSKDQFVIVCVDSATTAATALPWARHWAEQLNHKSLFALHVSRDGGTPDWLTRLDVPYVSLQGDWHTAIEGLPTAFNGILAVTAVDPTAPRTSLAHPKTLLHEFRDCKVAYLVVSDTSGLHNTATPPPGGPESSGLRGRPLAVLTMTHHREGKEKLVWASYLARFLRYNIAIAHPDYRDGDLRMRWRNNMRFVDKLFSPLGIDYTTPTLPKLTQVDMLAIEHLHPDILIARTTDTRERDLVDWLLPRIEPRLLTHHSHTPILFLNPRDDLYILCD